MNDQLRFDLCCGARALYRAGLSVGIAGHLSIGIGENRMLANRFGPSFGTLTPDDVLVLDWDGNLLEGRGAVNETIRLHGVIHKRNPSIVGVAHTHPPATVTLGTFSRAARDLGSGRVPAGERRHESRKKITVVRLQRGIASARSRKR